MPGIDQNTIDSIVDAFDEGIVLEDSYTKLLAEKAMKPLIDNFDPEAMTDKYTEDIISYAKMRGAKPKKIINSSGLQKLQYDDGQGLLDVGNSFTHSLITMFADTGEKIGQYGAYAINAIKGTNLEDYIDKEIYNRRTRREKDLSDFFRMSKENAGSILYDAFPAGLGSMVGFAIMGALTNMALTPELAIEEGMSTKAIEALAKSAEKSAAIKTGISASVTGALSESLMLAHEAYQATGSTSIANIGSYMGILLGATEGLPIGHAYLKASKMFKDLTKDASIRGAFGTFLKSFNMKDHLIEGLEEFTQEFGQTVGENWTAQNWWDHSRKLFDTAFESGSIGFVSGVLMSMLMGISAGTKAMTPEQRKLLLQTKEVIEDMQKAASIVNEDGKVDANKAEEVAIAGSLTKMVKTFWDKANLLKSSDKDNEDTIKEIGKVAHDEAMSALKSEDEGRSTHNLAIIEAERIKSEIPQHNLLSILARFGKSLYKKYAEKANIDDPYLRGDGLGGLSIETEKKVTEAVYDKLLNSKEGTELDLGLTDEELASVRNFVINPDDIKIAKLLGISPEIVTDIAYLAAKGIGSDLNEAENKLLESLNNPVDQTIIDLSKAKANTAMLLEFRKDAKNVLGTIRENEKEELSTNDEVTDNIPATEETPKEAKLTSSPALNDFLAERTGKTSTDETNTIKEEERKNTQTEEQNNIEQTVPAKEVNQAAKKIDRSEEENKNLNDVYGITVEGGRTETEATIEVKEILSKATSVRSAKIRLTKANLKINSTLGKEGVDKYIQAKIDYYQNKTEETKQQIKTEETKQQEKEQILTPLESKKEKGTPTLDKFLKSNEKNNKRFYQSEHTTEETKLHEAAVSAYNAYMDFIKDGTLGQFIESFKASTPAPTRADINTLMKYIHTITIEKFSEKHPELGRLALAKDGKTVLIENEGILKKAEPGYIKTIVVAPQTIDDSGIYVVHEKPKTLGKQFSKNRTNIIYKRNNGALITHLQTIKVPFLNFKADEWFTNASGYLKGLGELASSTTNAVFENYGDVLTPADGKSAFPEVGGTAAELLEFLSNKNVIAPEFAFLEVLVSVIAPNVNVVLEDEIVNVPAATDDINQTFTSKAYYNPDTKTIHISKSIIIRNRSDLRLTVLHELLHAYTVHYMEANTQESNEFVKEIEDIMDDFVNFISNPSSNVNSKIYTNLPKRQLTDIINSLREVNNGASRLEIALQSPQEFLTQAMAEDGTIARLLGFIYKKGTSADKGNSYWSKFYRGLTAFLYKSTGLKQKAQPNYVERSLLEEVKNVLEKYQQKIEMHHSSNTKLLNIYGLDYRASKVRNIEELRDTQSNENEVNRYLGSLDPGQELDLEPDELIGTARIMSVIKTLADTSGMTQLEYTNTYRNITLEAIQRQVNTVNKAFADKIDKIMKNDYAHSSAKMYMSYQEYKRRFLTALVIKLTNKKTQTYVSVEFFTGSKKRTNIRTYGGDQFTDATGTVKNSSAPDIILQTYIPLLEKALQLPEGSLDIVFVNDFTKYYEWTSRGRTTKYRNKSSNILYLDHSMFSNFDKNTRTNFTVSELLAHTINSTSDVEGNKYIYLGNFGGGKLVPLIRIKSDVIDKAEQSIKKLLPIYNMIAKTDEAWNPIVQTDIMRNLLDDLFFGNVIFGQNTVIDPQRSVANSTKDANSMLKRGPKWTREHIKPYLKPDIFKYLEKDINDYIGFEKTENGKVLFNVAIFGSESEDPNIHKLLVNSLGTPYHDGASYYVLGQFDKVYSLIWGLLKQGAYKNAFISSYDALHNLYIKHAMHGVPAESELGKYMIKNNIAMLTSIESAKQGLKETEQSGNNTKIEINNLYSNEKAKTFKADIENLYRIKEEHVTKTNSGTLRQTVNSSGFGSYNTALTQIVDGDSVDLILSDLSHSKLTDLKDYLSKLSDTDFLLITKNIAISPKSFTDDRISNVFYPIFSKAYDEVKEKYGGIIHDPAIAEVLRYKVMNQVQEALQFRVRGGRLALHPSLGKGAAQQQVDPVINGGLTAILNESIDSHILKVAIPNDKIRENAKLYIVALSYMYESTDVADVNHWRSIKDEAKSAIENELSKQEGKPKKLRSITDLVDKNHPDVIKYLDSRLNGKVLDPDTGLIQPGYALVSENYARQHGVSVGDKVLVVTTPTDSLGGVIVVEIAGIMPSHGSRKVVEENKIVMNSEYIQSFVGKDYDIDTLSVMPVSKLGLSNESLDTLIKVFSNIDEHYKDMMVRAYKKVLGPIVKNTETGESIIIDKKSIYLEKNRDFLMRTYAQKLLGVRENTKQSFKSFGHDFHDLQDKYINKVGLVIAERTRHSMLSAINFEMTFAPVTETEKELGRSYKVTTNDKEAWEIAHVLHLIMTNHSVDAPNNTSFYTYNSNLADEESKLKFWIRTYIPDSEIKKLGKVEQSLDAIERMTHFYNIIHVLFGRALALAKSNEYDSSAPLEFFKQSKDLLIQRNILNALESGQKTRIDNIIKPLVIDYINKRYAYTNGKETPPGVKQQILNEMMALIYSIKVKNLRNYPLFNSILNINPYSLPKVGLAYNDFLMSEAKAISKIIFSMPQFMDVLNKARETINKKYPTLANRKTPGKSVLTIAEMLRYVNDGSLYTLRAKAVNLISASGEYSAGTSHRISDVLRLNREARKYTFPLLFKELLYSPNIDAKNKVVRINDINPGSKITYLVGVNNSNKLYIKLELNEKDGEGDMIFSSDELLYYNSLDEKSSKYSAEEKLMIQVAKRLMGVFTATDGTSVWESTDNRLKLTRRNSGLLNLYQNVSVESRTRLFKHLINNELYREESPYSDDERKLFWLAVLGQVSPEEAKANHIVQQDLLTSKTVADIDNPLKYKSNSIAKDVMSVYETELFEQYAQLFSHEASMLASTSINNSLKVHDKDVSNVFAASKIYHQSNFVPDSPHQTQEALFDKYQEDLLPGYFTTPAFIKFHNILEKQGYNAAFKELQKLTYDVATRMALIENGINGKQLQMDIQHLTPAQFKEKYKDVADNTLQRATQAAKKVADKKIHKYSPEVVKNVTDQAKNNLESIFWTLHIARKPYVKYGEPTNFKILNEILNGIGSFENFGPKRELKNYAMADPEQIIADSFTTDFTLSKANKSGSGQIKVKDVIASQRLYSTRTWKGVGESSLLIHKIKKLDKTIKAAMNFTRHEILDKVIDVADLGSSKNRTKLASKVNTGVGYSIEDVFIHQWTLEYGTDEEISSLRIAADIYDVAKNMGINTGIYVRNKFVRDDTTGEIHYSPDVEYVRYVNGKLVDRYDTIVEFVDRILPSTATGRDKLTLYAALKLRELYDLRTSRILDSAIFYLEKVAFELHRLQDYDSQKLVMDILERFEEQRKMLGDAENSEDNVKVIKSKMQEAEKTGLKYYGYGNYLPEEFPKEDLDYVHKEQAYHKAKASLIEDIKTNRRLFELGRKNYDPEYINPTKEWALQEVERRVASTMVGTRVNSPGTASMANFIPKYSGKTTIPYIKNDLQTHNNYLNKLQRAVHNDILSAEYILYKSRAKSIGEKASLISEAGEWITDQVQNKILRTIPVNIRDLKRGQEINFMHEIYHNANGTLQSTSAVIQGVVEKVVVDKNGDTFVHLYKDTERTKSVSRRRITQLYNELRSPYTSLENTDIHYWLDRLNEMVNLKKRKFITKEEAKSVFELDENGEVTDSVKGKELLETLIKAYDRILKDPKNYERYNAKDIHISTESKQVLSGTHVNLYRERGGIEFIKNHLREARNIAAMDGTDVNSLPLNIYNAYKFVNFFPRTFKLLSNWLIMGGVAGPAASALNATGAFKNNHIDDIRHNWRLRNEGKAIFKRLSNTPYDAVLPEDRQLYEEFESLGFLGNKWKMDISLAGSNIEAEKLLLDKSALQLMKIYGQVVFRDSGYTEYRKRLKEYRDEYLKAFINEEEEKEREYENKIHKLEIQWKAYANGIAETMERVSPEEEATIEKRIMEETAKGTFDENKAEEILHLTRNKAAWLLAKNLAKKAYTSKSLGVGLQSTAEIQRSSAYFIGYLKAKEYGFSEKEAQMAGFRNVERQHAMYDNSYKQKFANTMLGQTLYQYAQYKLTMFKKMLQMISDSIPQVIQHRKRLKTWYDTTGWYGNLKFMLKKNIQIADDALTELKQKKNNDVIVLKDENIANFLFQRLMIGLFSAQISAALFYGWSNSDDPVTQTMFDVIKLIPGALSKDKAENWDEDVLWAIQSTMFWAGLPVSLGIQMFSKTVFYDWDEAVKTFDKGRFKLQKSILTERLGPTLKKVYTSSGLAPDDVRVRWDEKTLFDIKLLDQMLGVKLIGYSKVKNGWVDHRDRFPMALNPYNWIPTVEVEKQD